MFTLLYLEKFSLGMLSQFWIALLLGLVPSPFGITSALPSIPNPQKKGAFDQILQANLGTERDCKYMFVYP